jgi:hypothetical protein
MKENEARLDSGKRKRVIMIMTYRNSHPEPPKYVYIGPSPTQPAPQHISRPLFPLQRIETILSYLRIRMKFKFTTIILSQDPQFLVPTWHNIRVRWCLMLLQKKESIKTYITGIIQLKWLKEMHRDVLSRIILPHLIHEPTTLVLHRCQYTKMNLFPLLLPPSLLRRLPELHI